MVATLSPARPAPFWIFTGIFSVSSGQNTVSEQHASLQDLIARRDGTRCPRLTVTHCPSVTHGRGTAL